MSSQKIHTRLIVLGSGPAGYSAAIYAARAMREPMLITGLQQGGQLTITTDVENYPGFEHTVQGPWLVEQMHKQAEHCGTKMVYDTIIEADLKKHPFTLVGDSGTHYTCDSLIIATGAKAKWLGLPSEEAFSGFGVSACATCDGFFYRNKEVVVIGGGNTAVEEALYLANLASKVTLVHRRDSLRAERIMQERLFAHPKIDVIWNTQVSEILGTQDPKSVNAVLLKNLEDGTTRTLSTHGVFVAIGHEPATSLFKDQIKLKPSGCIWVEAGSTRTSIAGVFAAGDVSDDHYRQAVTAAGMGCMSALDADRFLADLDAGMAKSTPQGVAMMA